MGKIGSFLRSGAAGASQRVAQSAQRVRERRQRRAERVAGLVSALTQRLLAWRAQAGQALASSASAASASASVPRFASGFPRVPAALIAATAVAAASPLAASPSFQKRLANLIQSSMKNFVHAFEGPRRDTLVLLLSTTLVVPIMTRLKTSPILGFLLTGMALGPRGLSVVNDIKTTEALAELGIVFFLFEMGLELSVERLFQMRRDVFGLGFAQFSVSAVAIFLISRLLGVPGPTSVVIGGALALSSSAFVLQLLRDKDSLGTRHGRASFGVLLFQDLAVVPLLVVTPLLTAGGGSAMAWAMGWAACKAGLAFSVILLFGKFVLDRIFNFVAKSQVRVCFHVAFFWWAGLGWVVVWVGCLLCLVRSVDQLVDRSMILNKAFSFPPLTIHPRTQNTHAFPSFSSPQSHEAFLAVILVTVLTMSNLTEGLGLSNTLGAFMAGVLLSETKYRYQVRLRIGRRWDLVLRAWMCVCVMGGCRSSLWVYVNPHPQAPPRPIRATAP
jgi:Kef-type K+ transport system membrane component KefB